MLSSTANLTVSVARRSLSKITVTATGPTSISTGERIPVHAMATYSDNSTADITYQCQWSTSDPRMALVSNAIFQHLQGTGTVSAICAYTENRVSLSGSLLFTITLDPSLQPTRGQVVPTSPNSFTGSVLK